MSRKRSLGDDKGLNLEGFLRWKKKKKRDKKSLEFLVWF